ncbi:AAA family ATPase [Lacihabitans sp. CS3-21]|uniref:AAA family ATPase n=1 Tax=Lacihabitans sp. CS3-21 TaxID=2487332 RepID=UPI0020CC3E57|nr:AAA family ATPase [Lacihabitans sp. CS3-21]MCP9748889.1 hypothetical protein [Lacihabitans sp. CS3-21]
MKIKSLNIKNFKSIVDITINGPNPFTVFVGPNGSGKSNIFEALEFANLMTDETDYDKKTKIEGQFGDCESFLNVNNEIPFLSIGYEFDKEVVLFSWRKKNKETDEQLKHLRDEAILNKSKYLEMFRILFKDDERFENDPSFAEVPFDFLINRYDKLLSSKVGSYSFTIPVHKDKLADKEELYSTENFNLDNSEFYNEIGTLLQNSNYSQFFDSFSRIFLNSRIKDRSNFKRFLKNDGSNLEKAISFLLKNEVKREELLDWLRLFIPEFEDLKYSKNEISGKNGLQIFEKKSNIPFNTSLISDGTFNILAMLTAVLQSDEPQFLCIEEPENGLHPKVVKELVNLFRDACEEYGHYIWINTHSQTLVSKLKPHEVILVDKVDGETRIKQLKDFNLHGFEMDEAWLSNALGGGIPW